MIDYGKYKEIQVMLYGQKVGTLFDDGNIITFYYSKSFKIKGIEISPIKLNTKKIISNYTNDDYPDIYNYLPGIIRDSLPDSNGKLVMDKYFTAQGLDPTRVSVLHRLAFIGNRAIGALEYVPSEHSDSSIKKETIQARELYIQNRNIHDKEENLTINEIIAHMIDSASPVGGAKEKMLICFNPATKQLRFCNSSNESNKDGYEPYLMKFDSDKIYKEETIPEFVYMSLAKLCGIEVMDFELLEDGDRKHYLTKRFDRKDNKKIHTATASALLHKPHMRNGITYEELTRLTYEITKSVNDVKKLLKQMIFNIVMAVTDDHAKNFSFLMNENGKWKLSPAYDLVYGLGAGALRHKTSLCGKNDKFICEDILRLSREYDIEEEEVLDMLFSVITTFRENFKKIADTSGMSSTKRDGIEMSIVDRINILIESL